MCTIIHGIPVSADSTLPREKINNLVSDLVQTWEWEGRQLGKVELINDGKMIHVYSYEKPSIKFVPLKNNTDEVKG